MYAQFASVKIVAGVQYVRNGPITEVLICGSREFIPTASLRYLAKKHDREWGKFVELNSLNE